MLQYRVKVRKDIFCILTQPNHRDDDSVANSDDDVNSFRLPIPPYAFLSPPISFPQHLSRDCSCTMPANRTRKRGTRPSLPSSLYSSLFLAYTIILFSSASRGDLSLSLARTSRECSFLSLLRAAFFSLTQPFLCLLLPCSLRPSFSFFEKQLREFPLVPPLLSHPPSRPRTPWSCCLFSPRDLNLS